MSYNKRYYYLKLKENFFDKSEIKIMDNNRKDRTLIFYLKLLCRGNYYKRGYRIHKIKVLNVINLKEYLKIIFNSEVSDLDYLKDIGLIYIKDNDIIIKDINIGPIRDRECKKYRNWRNSVFQRDNFTCRKCNKRGNKLNAHHIKSWVKYKEFRFDINNGLTLCVECHKNIHRKR